MKKEIIDLLISEGFKQNKYPGWVQMEKFDEKTDRYLILEFNIKGGEGNYYLYSFRPTVYFKSIGEIFVPIYNSCAPNKVKGKKFFGITPQEYIKIQNGKFIKDPNPLVSVIKVETSSDLKKVINEQIYSYCFNFFNEVSSIDVYSQYLDNVDDKVWFNLLGDYSIFLKLILMKLRNDQTFDDFSSNTYELIRNVKKDFINNQFQNTYDMIECIYPKLIERLNK